MDSEEISANEEEESNDSYLDNLVIEEENESDDKDSEEISANDDEETDESSLDNLVIDEERGSEELS